MAPAPVNSPRTMRRLLAAAAVAALLAAGTAAAAPGRIVSMNVCTDQLVMLLADRARIASVSDLALDPKSSAMAAEARGLHVNHGLAEEVMALRPDLVLAGAYTTRPTVSLLRRLGLAVVEVPVAESIEDVRRNIRLVADAVGERARGERLVSRFDRQLRDARELAAEPPSPPPLAALYWANGFTSGVDTLADDILAAAGFETLGARLALRGTVRLSLEQLLLADADVLVTGRQYGGAALAREIFRHPALRRAYGERRRLAVADHLWTCGTPYVARAVRQLAEARVAMRGRE